MGAVDAFGAQVVSGAARLDGEEGGQDLWHGARLSGAANQQQLARKEPIERRECKLAVTVAVAILFH